MKILDDSVNPGEGDTWDFQCPGITGSKCGDPAAGAFFASTGWPTKKVALARGRQHFDEHKGLGVAQSLEDFRRDHNLVVNDDGTVSLEDI